MVKNSLKAFCHALEIEYVGIAPPGPYFELEEILKSRIGKGYYTGFEEKELERRIYPALTLDGAQSVIVCLFPYFTGDNENANLSKSAFSLDYHRIIRQKLGQIGESLKVHIKDFRYKAFVDNGPLVDRYLAYLAGLGFFGINNHIITDSYGSYVFIGYIINNYPFEPDKPLDRTCVQCGHCVSACPGCAILGDFELNPLNCLSYITQKKEALSAEEIEILNKNHLIYGCDICQDVCPHNKKIACTKMDAFHKHLMYSIESKELDGLSNRAFKKKYGNRTFGWIGRKTLVRNLGLLRRKKE